MTTPTLVLRGTRIASPVRALAPALGRVVSRAGAAIYADFNGFVVALTARPVPVMANSISFGEGELPPARPGAVSRLGADEVVIGESVVDLSQAGEWDPAVERNRTRSAREVHARAREVLAAIAPPAALPEASELMDALSERNEDRLRVAAGDLIGRGGGLTPEGDDVIVGAAAGVVAFGHPAGVPPQVQADLLTALCPPSLRRRTTSLSATFIELAVRGKVAEPMQSILDLSTPDTKWRRAARQLRTLGHSTGRAWCWGAASAGVSLTQARS